MGAWLRKPRLYWADSSHHSNNEVHTTLPACPPACQCDILSLFCRTHTLTRCYLLIGRGDRLLTDTHTHYSVLGRRKDDERERRILSHGFLFIFLTIAGCGSWIEATTPTIIHTFTHRHTHTHTSLPQPRILGLVLPGVESGSHKSDQHGEPGGQTGGNRVRSASVVLWFASVSLSVCLFVSVYLSLSRDFHFLWANFLSCHVRVHLWKNKGLTNESWLMNSDSYALWS